MKLMMRWLLVAMVLLAFAGFAYAETPCLQALEKMTDEQKELVIVAAFNFSRGSILCMPGKVVETKYGHLTCSASGTPNVDAKVSFNGDVAERLPLFSGMVLIRINFTREGIEYDGQEVRLICATDNAESHKLLTTYGESKSVH